MNFSSIPQTASHRWKFDNRIWKLEFYLKSNKWTYSTTSVIKINSRLLNCFKDNFWMYCNFGEAKSPTILSRSMRLSKKFLVSYCMKLKNVQVSVERAFLHLDSVIYRHCDSNWISSALYHKRTGLYPINWGKLLKVIIDCQGIQRKDELVFV